MKSIYICVTDSVNFYVKFPSYHWSWQLSEIIVIPMKTLVQRLRSPLSFCGIRKCEPFSIPLKNAAAADSVTASQKYSVY